MKIIGKVLLSVVAFIILAWLLTMLGGALKITETVIEREVFTNSQGYTDAQAIELLDHYDEYMRLSLSAMDIQWCQAPACDRNELIDGYRLAQTGHLNNMKRLVQTLPASEVPSEVQDLLNAE